MSRAVGKGLVVRSLDVGDGVLSPGVTTGGRWGNASRTQFLLLLNFHKRSLLQPQGAAGWAFFLLHKTFREKMETV